MVNRELLQRTLEHIKANPEQWDQVRWGRCFAGWAVRLDNPAIAERVEDVPRCPCCLPYVNLLEGKRPLRGWEIEERAQELLGLDPHQADDLFRACNALEYLERKVAELVGEEVPA